MPLRGATRTLLSASPHVNGEMIEVNPVTPGYLRALRSRLTRGRLFEEADQTGGAALAIVSESAARHFWPGANPIGQPLFSYRDQITVVGVVADIRRSGLEGAFSPTVYILQTQSTHLGITLCSFGRRAIRATSYPPSEVPSSGWIRRHRSAASGRSTT